jgi:hypothetical protein
VAQLPRQEMQLLARVKELMPVMNKCGTNEGFQAAMKRIEGDEKAPPPAKAEAPKSESKPETKPVKK